MKTSFITALILFTMSSFGQKVVLNAVRSIPEIDIYDLKGDMTNLKAISKDKITFVDFWFIPCGPCFVEMNMLHKIYAKYKDNPNFRFLTITLTDSAFVRPLIENKNTDLNETYDYFKSLAKLDTFKLPVYFIKGVDSKMKYFKRAKTGFSGESEPRTKKTNYKMYPEVIFGFSAYPTVIIFDKKGNAMYNKTGFTTEAEIQLQKKIEALINEKL